jgi:hypothetical protein
MIFMLIIVNISISCQVDEKFNFFQVHLHDLFPFINWISKQSKNLNINPTQNLFYALISTSGTDKAQ